MAETPEKPKGYLPRSFWTWNASAVVTTVICVCSVIYGASAFATKSNSDAANEAKIAEQLSLRIQAVDSRSAALESRMVGVETSLGFIRESLGRIERSLTPTPANSRDH